jgi:hypothetical protein
VNTQQHVVVGDRMYCRCGGLGVVTEVAEAAPGLLLVRYWTEHRPRCPGTRLPDRAFIMSAAALDHGDTNLPGIDLGDRTTRRQR